MKNAYKIAMEIADEVSKRKYLNSLNSRSTHEEKMTWPQIYERSKKYESSDIQKLKDEHQNIFEIAYRTLSKKDVENNFHPEQKDAEVFLGNTIICTQEEFDDHFGWRTKRTGKIAYNTEGEILPKHVPVFVNKSEIEKHDPEVLKTLQENQISLYPKNQGV